MTKPTVPAVKLSIVFLNYNRLPETITTVEHLRALTAGRPDLEVIAVDNASADATGAFLEQHSDWLRVVHMPENTGIAGYNEGFELAKGEYILVLDDDSHPYDHATLDNLIAHLDSHPQAGVVACRIESPAGDLVRTWHLPADLERRGHSIAFVGCGFAIRRDLFERVGWYPAEFFLYQNEIEVAIQVLRLGYTIDYCPDCRVVHREAPTGRPSWRRVYYPTRNTIWLIRRYFSGWQGAYMIFSRLCFGFIRAFQSQQWGWYYKAVHEAFSTPVTRDVLPHELYRQLRIFREQNSVWHHFRSHLPG